MFIFFFILILILFLIKKLYFYFKNESLIVFIKEDKNLETKISNTFNCHNLLL